VVAGADGWAGLVAAGNEREGWPGCSRLVTMDKRQPRDGEGHGQEAEEDLVIELYLN